MTRARCPSTRTTECARRTDAELFDSPEEMADVMEDFGLDAKGARLGRSLGLI